MYVAISAPDRSKTSELPPEAFHNNLQNFECRKFKMKIEKIFIFVECSSFILCAELQWKTHTATMAAGGLCVGISTLCFTQLRRKTG